jgi:hypothetical protein
MPDKRSDTIIEAISFGQRPGLLHNRYTQTETCVRWGMTVTVQTYRRYSYRLVTVSLLKRLRNGRSNFETALRWLQNRNRHLNPEVV